MCVTIHVNDFPNLSMWSHIWQVMNWDLGYMMGVLCLGSAGSLAVPCLGSVHVSDQRPKDSNPNSDPNPNPNPNPNGRGRR